MNKRYKVVSPKFVENKNFVGNLCSYIAEEMKEPRWYLNIDFKDPKGRKRYNKKKSLGYSITEISKSDPKLYNTAKQIFAKTVGEEFNFSEVVFSLEDIKIATKAKAIGRISEDKFKNLMMLNGYQVASPVEDMWGYDFIVTNGKGEFHTVQVKCTSGSGKSFPLQSTKGIPYKGRVSHLACVHLQKEEIYYIPTNKLPENKASFVINESFDQYKVLNFGIDPLELTDD
jgi:hypothetical protein